MRIAIAEDSAILRDGLVHLLTHRGHEVVATTDDGDRVVEVVREAAPDVAVIDIRMPPTHSDEGLRAAITLRRETPSIGVLVFSQYVETRYAGQLLAETPGGVGYLLKDRVADVRDFLDALQRIADGGTALDPEVVRQLVGTSRRGRSIEDLLTARERDVLELMAEGRSNAAIADALVIGAGAVEKNVANIFTKLDLPVSGHDNRRVLAVLRYLEAV